MKLLILGGTRFLGRHVAELALAQGHELSLLHRGQSGPELFPQAEHLIADRDGDLSVLKGGSWHAAIDTSAYVPRQVHSISSALLDHVERYLLVSSISAYADFSALGTDETAATHKLDDPLTETVSSATYGGLKALCEEAALAAWGERCVVARPGLIVGPHDPTGRFTWWLQRLQRGGEVLAPGRPDAPVQFIDVRDVSAWLLLQAQASTQGLFNITGPGQALTMGEFLRTTQAVLCPSAHLSWVDAQWLLDKGVKPWSELPVWLPPENEGLHKMKLARALATGIGFTPLAQTIADTAAWAATHPAPTNHSAVAQAAVGMAVEREVDLLARYSRYPLYPGQPRHPLA